MIKRLCVFLVYHIFTCPVLRSSWHYVGVTTVRLGVDGWEDREPLGVTGGLCMACDHTDHCLLLLCSRGGYMQGSASQNLSGALNRPNQMMQGSGIQGGAFGRRYWHCLLSPCSDVRVFFFACVNIALCFVNSMPHTPYFRRSQRPTLYQTVLIFFKSFFSFQVSFVLSQWCFFPPLSFNWSALDVRSWWGTLRNYTRWLIPVICGF